MAEIGEIMRLFDRVNTKKEQILEIIQKRVDSGEASTHREEQIASAEENLVQIGASTSNDSGQPTENPQPAASEQQPLSAELERCRLNDQARIDVLFEVIKEVMAENRRKVHAFRDPVHDGSFIFLEYFCKNESEWIMFFTPLDCFDWSKLEKRRLGYLMKCWFPDIISDCALQILRFATSKYTSNDRSTLLSLLFAYAFGCLPVDNSQLARILDMDSRDDIRAALRDLYKYKQSRRSTEPTTP